MCTVDSGSVKPRQSQKTVCYTCCFFHIAQNCFLITMKHNVMWRWESSNRRSDSSCKKNAFVFPVLFVDIFTRSMMILFQWNFYFSILPFYLKQLLFWKGTICKLTFTRQISLRFGEFGPISSNNFNIFILKFCYPLASAVAVYKYNLYKCLLKSKDMQILNIFVPH